MSTVQEPKAPVETTAVRRPLTPKQRAILRFIVRYWGERMVPPTMREIAAEFGFASINGVSCHLIALHEKGWIVRDASVVSESERKATSRGILIPDLVEAASRAADEFLRTL